MSITGTTGTTYFVDATGGNDGSAGTSESTAWQTIAKLNASTFNPGDTILFKRGETWTGTKLTVPSSGTSGHPITFADYGSGAKPIIDGNDTVNCIAATSHAYLAFRNLDCTQGLDSGFAFTTCNNITLTDCDAHDCGNDQVIFITSCHTCTVTRGFFYNGYQRVGGTVASGIEIADGCRDITLDGVTCYGQTGGPGISIHSHDGTELPYNITIQNAECYGNSTHGFQCWKQDDTADAARNIIIQDTTLRDNTQDGLRIYKAAGASNYPDGVTVQRVRMLDNTQYGYWLEGDNITVSYCACNNQRNFINACTGLTFSNNTHYSTVAGGLFAIYIQNARTDGITFRNCITQCTDAGGCPIGVAVGATTNVDIDWTLYDHPNTASNRWYWSGSFYSYANWLVNSSQDANSPTPADPLFTDAANDDFTLQAGSPARGAGEGGVDCGAYPYAG